MTIYLIIYSDQPALLCNDETVQSQQKEKEKLRPTKTKKQFNTGSLSLDTLPGLSRAFVNYLFLQANAIKHSPQTALLSAELCIKRHSGWSNIPLLRRAKMLVDDNVFLLSFTLGKKHGAFRHNEVWDCRKIHHSGCKDASRCDAEPWVHVQRCVYAPCLPTNPNSQVLEIKTETDYR